MEKKKSIMGDITVIGLALFAMFFGAGNLIFPPSLGANAGNEWFQGFLCFFVADIGLALLTILAIIKSGEDSVNGVTRKLGKVPATIINCAVVLCIGPFLAIPRTAATTFEMGILPVFPEFNTWIFGAIFFGLTFVFTIRSSKVVDIIGKFLTPILVVSLLAIIIIGVVNPIGPTDTPAKFETIKEGILAGYQTMDVLASMVFVLIVINAARDKGYTKPSETMSVVMKSSIFAAIALFVVYGGLAFLGATTSGGNFEHLNQAGLLVEITRLLVGPYGVIMLGVIVSFACLTTAIGLTSSAAAFFANLTKDKVSYEKVVTIIIVFSYIVSNFGLSSIISISAPVLNLVYPVVLVMVFLSYFEKRIQNHNVFIFASLFALIISAGIVLQGFGVELAFLNKLPLYDFQLAWILPAIVGGIVGKFVPMSEKAKLKYATDNE